MKIFLIVCVLFGSSSLVGAEASNLRTSVRAMAHTEGEGWNALFADWAKDSQAANEAAKLRIMEAFLNGSVAQDPLGDLWIKVGDIYQDAISGQSKEVQVDSLRVIPINNSIRRAIRQSLSALSLRSTDQRVFLESLEALEEPIPETILVTLEQRSVIESDPLLKAKIQQKIASTELHSDDPLRAERALQILTDEGKRETMSQLQRFLKEHPDSPLRARMEHAVSKLQLKFLGLETLGHTIYGLSLASILLLVSLGLAISFGLMKIINMAHGELLMVGAYVSYVLQSFLVSTPWASWSPLLSLPLAFLCTAGLGYALEKLIIRHLYGRPLETLLATWGISLILIQGMRSAFGAQNVEVAVPPWLTGGWSLAEGLVVPYNRLLAIGVSVFVVSGLCLFFKYSRFGLLIRAVQQNRSMAACLKISTDRVDAMTFALGSGLAGLGGAILSQITNVSPEMGQTYIIDSFLVVVLGGVGSIGGSVLGALVLGLTSKYIEAMSGAVIAKIIVMALIIIFIQKRPEGLLAYKGRSHEIDAA